MPALIAISTAIFFYCIIILCLSGKASTQGRVQSRLHSLTREANQITTVKDEELSRSFTDRVLRPLIQKILSRLPASGKAKKSDNNDRMKKMLMQAGWTISAEEYTVLQLILMVGCGALALVIALILKQNAMNCILFVVFGIFAAFSILRFICSSTVTKRKAAIEKQLPDLLDLLSISVVAGLGFERALSHLIEIMNGPLIDEFAVANREMAMGRSRKEALTLLGERCGVDDLTSVIGAIVQAGQLGIPIGNVLQSQAAAIRRSRRAKVQEKAAKISTKILLPMIGLIFPVLLIVLMGPAAITIIEELG